MLVWMGSAQPQLPRGPPVTVGDPMVRVRHCAQEVSHLREDRAVWALVRESKALRFDSLSGHVGGGRAGPAHGGPGRQGALCGLICSDMWWADLV